MPAPATRLGFFKLNVPDIGEATKFWHDAFGFSVTMTFDEPGFEEVVLALPGQADGPNLMLVRHKHDRAIAPGSAHGPIGFFCPDIEASFAHVVDAGARPTKEPFDVGGGTLVALLLSPQGHEIELVQLPAA